MKERAVGMKTRAGLPTSQAASCQQNELILPKGELFLLTSLFIDDSEVKNNKLLPSLRDRRIVFCR